MCLTPQTIKKQGYYISVPCGKCFECLRNKANEWAFRITKESELYEQNCMITLTYNEDNLPEGGSLVKRDLQLFMKRLRKHFEPKKIRFFACGEYGSKNGRPHFHIILFNECFEDKFYFCKDNKGTELYRSPTLEKLWDKGFSTIGEVNFDSAKYCAIYLQKPPSDGRKKPFTLMSRRPGIGFDAIKTSWLDSDKVYVNGKYIKLPRYFLDVLERSQPAEVEELKNKRLDKVLHEMDLREANIECDERYKRIYNLQKIFGEDFKNYFGYWHDFSEDVRIKEKTLEDKKIFKKYLDKYKK